MVSDVLNGTGHPTFQEFSPLAPISSSFLEELSFCALTASSIFALWMFSACFAAWAVFVPVLFGCVLLSEPRPAHRWLAACLRLSALVLEMLPGFGLYLQSTVI